MDILVNVVNQQLKIATNLKRVVAGTQKFVYFTFNLTDAWNDLTVFAQFRQGDTAYNQYLDSNNGVYLPAEIQVGKCTLMLYGSGENDVIATTNYITLTIDDNILVANAESTEISSSLYTQLVNSFNETVATIINKEDVSNKVTSLSSGSTDAQYPSAKCVRDELGRMQSAINTHETIYNKVTSISSSSTDTQYPSAKCVFDRFYNMQLSINTKENVSDKVTTLSASNTDTQYPSAKCVYDAVQEAMQNVLLNVYPVGSIYISVNPTSPATLFGGTWEEIQGKFLLARDELHTAGSIGGDATHRHTTPVLSEINYGRRAKYMPWNSEGSEFVSQTSETYSNSLRLPTATETNVTGYPILTGEGSSYPPYLTVYMWKRIADNENENEEE